MLTQQHGPLRPTLPHFPPPVKPPGRARRDPGAADARSARPARRGRRPGRGPPRRRRRGSRTGAARSSRRRCGSPRAPFSVSRSVQPVSGFWVVTTHRPTWPCGTTTASPIWTRRPRHPSSACGSMPSTPKFIRKRRPSIASTPSCSRERAERRSREQRRGAAATAVGRGQLRLDEPNRLPDQLRHRVRPRPDDDASRARPLVELRLDLSPRSTCAARPARRPAKRSDSAFGVGVVVRADELQRAVALVVDEPAALGDEVEPPVAAQPDSSSSASSTRWSIVAFTGVSEIQETRALIRER